MSLASHIAALASRVATEIKTLVRPEHPGIARAWVTFGYSASAIQISASHNVATVTRLAAGRYPPGNVKVNNVMWPTTILGQIALTWAHRDRMQQTVYLVTQSEGNIGPEAGVTYTVRFYNENNSLQKTLTGLTTTAWTYLTADEATDSGLGRINGKLKVEIEAVRAGYTSWQKQTRSVDRAGYGLNYGKYYGGI